MSTLSSVNSELQNWQRGGEVISTTLFGHKVFTKQFGDSNASADTTLLLIHGFPESSFSYHKVVEGLQQRFDRIVLFDFVGYGLSDKPTNNFTYSLFEQADIALQVWQQLGITGGHVLSHDMGDSVHTELIARHVSGLLPAWLGDGFKSFTFTNGSMVLELADLRAMQKALLTRWGPVLSKLSNKKIFQQQATSAQGTDRLSQNDLEGMWHNMSLKNGHKMNHLIIQYLNDRRRFEKTRWLPSLAKVTEPVHICWGEADAVATVSMAHYLKENVCTEATLTLMPNVGHFCQLSDPEIWLESVLAFYSTL